MKRRTWALSVLGVIVFYGAVTLASWLSGCADIGAC